MKKSFYSLFAKCYLAANSINLSEFPSGNYRNSSENEETNSVVSNTIH
jgi:hypothetical protein